VRENAGGLQTVDLSATCLCAWAGLIAPTLPAQMTVTLG
jgi:hypothetical protein